jgi:hypothetical protein
MKVYSLVGVFLLVLSVAMAADKSDGGFAIHAGVGGLYGGKGASIEYQIPVYEFVRLTPYVSAGFADPIYTGYNVWQFGYCAGLNIEFGRFHRLLIGLSFGSLYVDFDADASDKPYNINTVVGPALAIGYKGTAKFGLLWQVYGGICYTMNDQHVGHNGFAPIFGVGFGYKI